MKTNPEAPWTLTDDFQLPNSHADPNELVIAGIYIRYDESITNEWNISQFLFVQIVHR